MAIRIASKYDSTKWMFLLVRAVLREGKRAEKSTFILIWVTLTSTTDITLRGAVKNFASYSFK
jgi:hypothetical protein